MHEELTELLIHCNNALSSNQERIYGEGHCVMPPLPVPFLTLPFSQKEQINGAK